MLSVYREPPEVERTKPAPKEESVVEPETVSVPVMEVVAKLVMPETLKAVAEAVVRLVWPLPQRIPEMDREVAEATPKIGVIRVGEVCWTVKPVPVVPLV